MQYYLIKGFSTGVHKKFKGVHKEYSIEVYYIISLVHRKYGQQNFLGFTSVTLICETLLTKNAVWIKMMTAFFLSLTEVEAQILVVSVVNSKIRVLR